MSIFSLFSIIEFASFTSFVISVKSVILVFADTVIKSSKLFPIVFNESSIELNLTYSIFNDPLLYAFIKSFPSSKCCFIKLFAVFSSNEDIVFKFVAA